MNSKRFAFALHGGAGARSGRDYSAAEHHMRELTENARDRLASGARALDVVEYAVAQMESSGLYVAGRGSAPNSAGYVELDASIMDGPVSAAGAVSCIRDVVNPVSVARRVMEATPHVMLSGAGALAFARTQGFEEVADPRKYYTLPIGVNNISSQFSTDYSVVLAYTTLSMIPALIFYALAERQIIGGLTNGAVKE